ncbi:MAG: hypothetical protein HYU64_15175 [Armatimonadetes bacterium]|nr:hypothetical protein [Armatimonadota bacterium]
MTQCYNFEGLYAARVKEVNARQVKTAAEKYLDTDHPCIALVRPADFEGLTATREVYILLKSGAFHLSPSSLIIIMTKWGRTEEKRQNQI